MGVCSEWEGGAMSEKPATVQPVNWEAVKVLALVVGVRESARRMGISEEAVKRRCSREGWLSSPEAKAANKLAIAQRTGIAAPASPHLSPAALVMAEIAGLGQKSRLSLARGIAKAGEHVETLSGPEILDRSADVKAIAQTADLVHGWKDQTPNVKIRLDVLNAPSEQPVYDVDSTVEMDVTFSDSESTEVDDY